MTISVRKVAALGLLGAVLVGCGGGADTASPPPAPPAKPTAAPTAAPGAKPAPGAAPPMAAGPQGRTPVFERRPGRSA
ncbi:hypothetical protein ACWGBV_29055, partial [Streptomyces sp. NPDC055051]